MLLRRATVALTVDEVMLDPPSHEVRRGTDGEALTPTEFRLLGRLISVPGRPAACAGRCRLATRGSGQREHAGLVPAAAAGEARAARHRWPGRDRAWSLLSMGLTGFRARVVSLAVLTATLVVAVLVVLSHVLLTRATDADTRTLARTQAEAVAAREQDRQPGDQQARNERDAEPEPCRLRSRAERRTAEGREQHRVPASGAGAGWVGPANGSPQASCLRSPLAEQESSWCAFARPASLSTA
ncbi:hypothetical protein FB475_5169 [Kribbella jejuensis]|uniref:Uncharacterized protein n=1 Tax=Kribbella jejuensis TaxID=236068 RepID=A0A542EA79_9ACTN|nr:hypothetical protein FB475_5169 [Kribbella jejuensis]